MGYFNIKWRKILTVLMIINLCFILFSKITKSFGASSITIDKPEKYTFNLNSKFDEYSYFYIFYQPDFVIDSSTPVHVMSFYFCASKSPITFKQAMYNYYGEPYFTTFVKTADNSDFYWYSMNQSINDSFLSNITSFNNFVNSSATLSPSNSPTFTFENSGVTSNIQFNNIIGLYIPTNIEFENGNIAIPTTVFNAPHFDNIEEIRQGYPESIIISRGSYSEKDALYFHLLKITNTVPDGNQSTYYYDSKVFKLTKDSKYYKTYDADTENKYSYYYIDRSALTLDTNSSYLYVLSNSGDSISNSYGILQPDTSLGIYDVVESDTSGVITEQQALNDKIANINNNQQDISNNSNNINNYLNENTISNDTNQNIDTNLNFNNQNTDLNNLNNGFFTRLTTMLSNISNYDLKEDSVVNIPFPNSQKYLELHSNIFYNNVTGALRTIINAFWTFIFTFYLWKFINKIYIAVSTGNILDTFSSSGEAITNDML